MQEFTRLINENIDKCSQLFYDWLNWEYIRDLFFVPKYNKNGVMKAEFNKYMANIEHYPFPSDRQKVTGRCANDRKRSYGLLP